MRSQHASSAWKSGSHAKAKLHDLGSAQVPLVRLLLAPVHPPCHRGLVRARWGSLDCDGVPVSSNGAVRLLGRYTLHERIAAGGMASVHLGRLSGDAGFSRVVAIKCIHPHVAVEPEFLAMFIDEARLAARIRHPNVVLTLDVVREEDEVFLVMEYVEGASLLEVLKRLAERGQKIPLDIAVRVVCDCLRGLHNAHEAKSEQGEPLRLIHRDVSPHNILIGVDGTSKIADFGIAKAVGRLQTTRGGQMRGKLGYAAPEQLRGEILTPRTDLYAAGITLWEALAGRKPIDGESESEIVLKTVNGRILPLHDVAPEVPLALSELVSKALSLEPRARFESAREMADALEAAVGVISPSKVGDWLGSLMADTLAERAKRVAGIEGAEPVTPQSSSADSITTRDLGGLSRAQTPVPKPRKLRFWQVATLFACLGAGVWALSTPSLESSPEAVRPASVRPSVTAPSEPPDNDHANASETNATSKPLGALPQASAALPKKPSPRTQPSVPQTRPNKKPATKPLASTPPPSAPAATASDAPLRTGPVPDDLLGQY